MKLQIIKHKIFELRGQRVMLDFDLAELYEIETKALKRAVRRNITRFPEDFMFELTQEECESNLRYQNGTSSLSWGGSRYLPFAFNVHGVSMLASVLHSEKAVEMNIAIVRAFVALTEFVYNYKELFDQIKEMQQTTGNHDKKLNEIYQAVEYLLQLEEKREEKSNEIENRKRIGFSTSTGN